MPLPLLTDGFNFSRRSVGPHYQHHWSERRAPCFQHSGSQLWSECSTTHQATMFSRHLVSHGDRLTGQYFHAVLRERHVSAFPNSTAGRPRGAASFVAHEKKEHWEKWSNILKPQNLHAIPCVVLEVQLSSLRILAGYYVVLHVLALPSTIHIA